MRIICMAVCAIVSLTLAQGMRPFNPFAGLSSPEQTEIKSGTWTLYKLSDSGEGKSGKMKFAVVGEEAHNNEQCYWFELEMWEENGDHDIIKFLSKEGPIGSGNHFSTIMKHNDEPAYEFEMNASSEEIKNQYASQAESTNTETEIVQKQKEHSTMEMSDERYDVKTSTEKITVPAGTFDCTRLTRIDKETNERSDVWYTEKVPIPGIVKLDAEDMKMELTEYDTKGAKSAITETPIKFNMQDMMRQQMKQSMDKKEEDMIKDAFRGGGKSIFGK